MTQVKFSADFFKGNREKLRQTLKADELVAITANGLLQRGADSSYPFSQDANFWYLTGINEPDIVLVIEGTREFLISPIREGSRITFDGQINHSELSKASGIGDVINEAGGWKRLDSLLQKHKQLATPAPAAPFIEQYGMYANPARSRFLERIEQHVPDIELQDIRPILASLRMIKQEPELKAIQQAIDITLETLKDVLSNKHYRFEHQIEAEITRGFRFRGADGHAFEPIVAGGKRACTLHNITNSGALRPNELVVMDVGASVGGYAADITRMYIEDRPTKRQKDIFNAVKEAQSYAISLLAPGVHLRSYEKKVAKFIGLKLKELGVTKDLKEDSIRQYFPHATSHFLGLNVHDVGDYQKPLKPGMVITVEPGIYIPGEAIGVRLEDDVLITEDGVKVLSSRLPSKL